jgi:pimeloyl-ACP methyl ester carboxylesterase
VTVPIGRQLLQRLGDHRLDHGITDLPRRTRPRLVTQPVDPISGGHVLPRIAERVPNAEVIVIDGVGHYPQIEDPDAVARALVG